MEFFTPALHNSKYLLKSNQIEFRHNVFRNLFPVKKYVVGSLKNYLTDISFPSPWYRPLVKAKKNMCVSGYMKF